MGFWVTSGTDTSEQAPDVALMLRVRDGDEKAFARLYDGHFRRVLDFFYGLSRDRHTADDLCQETFLRIWKLRKRYAATGAFRAYLFTIARNIWLEHCRSRWKIQRLGKRGTLLDHYDGLAVSDMAHPDALAGRSELSTHLFQALGGLPEEQRMVFILRNVEGLSLAEIAEVMQCPVNTVRSRRGLALKKLRKALNRISVSYFS